MVVLNQIEVAAADLGSGWRMADVLSRGELSCIVEEPRHRRVAIDILPENVVAAVSVEVAGAENVPARIGGANVLNRGDMATRHQPFSDVPVVAPEQDIGLAIAIEVARAHNVRARRRRADVDNG